MEKKTIGKFISVLRRAKGMTQRELGERLYVSDKTVSRWECDECTPELSLIPLIAEIFDITTDELLRGERNKTQDVENSENLRAKSDKQFKLMLHNSKRKYDNLSLISIGIMIAGLIVAIICNLGFNRGLLGFCLGCIFFIASIICQVCFTVNSRFLIDEDEKEYINALKRANTDRVLKAVNILFFVVVLWGFCLPIAILPYDSNWGLNFESWLLYGALFSLIGFIASYIIYKVFILKLLVNKELVFLSDTETECLKNDNKLLKRVLVVFISVFLVIMIAIYIVNVVFDVSGFVKKERFDNPDDFIEFVQNDYDKWFKEGYGDINNNNLIIDNNFTNSKVHGEIDGKEYYYNPNLYHGIIPDQYGDGKYEIVVITKEAYNNGHDTFDTVNICLVILHIVNFVSCVGWYCVGSYKKKQSIFLP